MNTQNIKKNTSFLLPIIVVIIISGFLLLIFYPIKPWGINNFLGIYQFIPGSIIFLPGFILYLSCIRLFHEKGKGTLAPWSPPGHLVIQGPYKYIRNPMIASVLIMLTGVACGSGSPVIGIWTLLFFLLNTIYFKYSEEPGLVKRFGDKYEEYKKNVPMWVPGLFK